MDAFIITGAGDIVTVVRKENISANIVCSEFTISTLVNYLDRFILVQVGNG